MPRVRPHPKPTRLPTFLRAWRDYRKLTQAKAADSLGIDQSTLSRIERGQTPYDQDFLEKAAYIYMCEPADLIMRNPLREDAVWSITDNLRRAPEELREQIKVVVEALIKRAN